MATLVGVWWPVSGIWQRVRTVRAPYPMSIHSSILSSTPTSPHSSTPSGHLRAYTHTETTPGENELMSKPVMLIERLAKTSNITPQYCACPLPEISEALSRSASSAASNLVQSLGCRA